MLDPKDPMGVARQLYADKATIPMTMGGGLLNAQMNRQSPPIMRPPEQTMPTEQIPGQVKTLRPTADLPPPIQPPMQTKQGPTAPLPRRSPFLDEFRRRALDQRMRRRFLGAR